MNKISFAILTAVFIGVIAYFSTGCKKSPTVTEYTIKVDSVQHADTINLGATFEVLFYAKIGDNDCYEFARFDPVFGMNLIEVTLIGKHTDRSDCVDGARYLNPGAVGFTDLSQGDWTLKVIEPEGVPLESTVYVK